MAKIFISYRRDDSAYPTGIIRDQLSTRLPGSEVFFDVDSIPYGVHFRRHLETTVSNCDYLVAVIGKSWLTVVDSQGKPRLEDPNDFVRIEIETALRRQIPLIPVFLDNMPVPLPSQLPESMRELVMRNAIFVRPPPDFHRDLDKLVESFQGQLNCPTDQNQGEATVSPKGSSHGAFLSRRKWIGLGVLLVGLVVFSFLSNGRSSGLPEYDIVENYLFEDSNPQSAPWQPNRRSTDGVFRMPVGFVHWVIIVSYPKNTRPTEVPLQCLLVHDVDGEIARFTGLSGTLPDSTYPNGGKTQWILNLGGRSERWKPGRYTIEMSTPTKSLNTSFEILPPAKASDQTP